eukprot:m.23287 g.23287  ORF g.23287 m.23287 type:complete len:160 (-) comp14152_c0_seq2:21-500(-)
MSRPTKEILIKLQEAGIKKVFDRFVGSSAAPTKNDCAKYFRHLPGNNTLDDNKNTGLMKILRSAPVADREIMEFSEERLSDAFQFVPGEIEDEYNLLGESNDGDDDDDNDEPPPEDESDKIDEQDEPTSSKRGIDEVDGANDADTTDKKPKKKTKKKKR